jgi:hypothetical protein
MVHPGNRKKVQEPCVRFHQSSHVRSPLRDRDLCFLEHVVVNVALSNLPPRASTTFLKSTKLREDQCVHSVQSLETHQAKC